MAQVPPHLVTHTPLRDRAPQIYFATQHAYIYLFADVINACCVNGMSMLLPRAHLQLIGGLQPYASYLAEDFFLTHALFNRGLRHRICRLPARQWPGPVTFKDVVMRQLRFVLRVTFSEKQSRSRNARGRAEGPFSDSVFFLWIKSSPDPINPPQAGFACGEALFPCYPPLSPFLKAFRSVWRVHGPPTSSGAAR